jgi:hypothetical protein
MFKYLVSILLLVSQVAALHFYLEGDQQRCFYEELPKGTLVVGEYQRGLDGVTHKEQYRARSDTEGDAATEGGNDATWRDDV